MSNSGERKRPKFKTAPLDASEATTVGVTIPGWESVTNETDAVPDEWHVDTATTEEIETLPHPEAGSSTASGPAPDYDLAAGAKQRAHKQTDEKSAAQRASRPAIEVEVRRVSNTISVTRKPPPAYEIWTKNRVYALDSAMSCIEVIDLATGQSDPKHPFVGAQVVGGQRRVSGNNELTFPLPTPGAEAVFQTYDASRRPRLMVTSKVTRVLLHVQVVRVSEKNSDDTWGKLASTRRIQNDD